MKAEVLYLARLARQATGQPVLRPPRQPSADDFDASARPPGRLGPEEPMTPGPMAAPPAMGTGPAGPAARRGGPAAPVPAVAPAAMPAVSAWPEPAAGASASPDIPNMPQSPRAASHRADIADPGIPGTTVAAPADPAGTCAVTAPTSAPQARAPRPAANAGPARPPGSRPSARRGRPAALPEAVEPAPMASGADRQAGPEPRTAPAARPPWPAPVAPAGPRQDPRTDGAGALAARRAAGQAGAPGGEGTAEPAWSRESAALRDLEPPLTSDPPPAAMSRTEQGVPQRARVSIGTIEVTVLPPNPPVPAVDEIRYRPPSALAASAGAGRLRDGLRRWYGTAQG
jgi:hypothetical protein